MGTTLTTSGALQPRFYVACLAAYNEGTLHAAWIDATADAWEMWSEIAAMLRSSPILEVEDYVILDSTGFGGRRIERFASLDCIAEMVALLRAQGAGEYPEFHQAAGW